MLDIHQWIRQEDGDARVRGHLSELDPWTEEIALERARGDGLELTDDHLGIIRYLRDCYADNGGNVNARMLMKTLEEEFAGLGGYKFLYNLFPRGPIASASRYAGLPRDFAAVQVEAQRALLNDVHAAPGGAAQQRV